MRCGRRDFEYIYDIFCRVHCTSECENAATAADYWWRYRYFRPLSFDGGADEDVFEEQQDSNHST